MRNSLNRLFRALENFNFRLWTAGGLVSNIGTWMQRVAQDWIVLTQLTHHDATAVGIVTGLQFAPQLLLLPWSGLAADRFNQRKEPAQTGSFFLCLSVDRHHCEKWLSICSRMR